MNSKNILHYSFKNNDNIPFDGEIIDIACDGSLLVKDTQQKKNLKISSTNNIELF